MRCWQVLVFLVSVCTLSASAQDQNRADRPADPTERTETAEQMRQRFLELAKQRANEMTMDELQFKVSELNRELRESEAEKSLRQVDELLSNVIRSYPNTFAARRATLALTALREPPTRLPPRFSISGSSPADNNEEQVEQVINIDALQRRLRQVP